MDLLNLKYFGQSRWSPFYQCHHCCYCDLPAAILFNELRKIQKHLPIKSWEKYQEEKEKAEAEGKKAEEMDPETKNSPLLQEWQYEFVDSAKESTGYEMGYRQVIHQYCLKVCDQREALILKDRNLLNLPLPIQEDIVDIYYYKNLPEYAICQICDGVLDVYRRGFAYPGDAGDRRARWDDSGRVQSRYLHYTCLDKIRNFQKSRDSK